MTAWRWVIAIVVIALIALLIVFARGPKGRDDRVTETTRWLPGYTRTA